MNKIEEHGVEQNGNEKSKTKINWARQGKARLGLARQGRARLGVARHGEAGQGKVSIKIQQNGETDSTRRFKTTSFFIVGCPL